MTDWVKGRSHTIYTVELPKKYHIDLSVAEHKSGKVTIRQACGKIIGTLSDLLRGKLDTNTSFLDKINKLMIIERRL